MNPLSTFLFVIVTEALRALLMKAKNPHMIAVFTAGKNGEVIIHFEFADDNTEFSVLQ